MTLDKNKSFELGRKYEDRMQNVLHKAIDADRELNDIGYNLLYKRRSPESNDLDSFKRRLNELHSSVKRATEMEEELKEIMPIIRIEEEITSKLRMGPRSTLRHYKDKGTSLQEIIGAIIAERPEYSYLIKL